MVKPIFRKATEQDAQALKAIASRVVREDYTSFLGKEAVDSFIESGMSDKEIDDGIHSCTVMIVDESIIGFCIINEDLLHLIMIDTVRQNSGYGSLLLSFVEDAMFNKHSKIYLQTFEKNTNAAQFYLKNGWNVTEKQFLPDMNQTMLFFAKER